MAKVKCPQCKKIFVFSSRYDNDFDRKIMCEKCGLILPVFSFDYAGKSSFNINSENVIDPVFVDFELRAEECDLSV